MKGKAAVDDEEWIKWRKITQAIGRINFQGTEGKFSCCLWKLSNTA